MTPTTKIRKLKKVHRRLSQCQKCPGVCGSPVHGPAIDTSIMLIGQAPGIHEAALGRPFAYTAGKTLFKWLETATGIKEEEMRQKVYFSAIARCFPGKALKGAGDRAPSREETLNCRVHLTDEVAALQPRLIIAVGRVALTEVLAGFKGIKTKSLEELVGRKFKANFMGHEVTVIPLPHPSGISRWPQTEPGKTKLALALKLIHDEFQDVTQ